MARVVEIRYRCDHCDGPEQATRRVLIPTARRLLHADLCDAHADRVEVVVAGTSGRQRRRGQCNRA